MHGGSMAGMGWLWLVGIVVLALVVWAAMRVAADGGKSRNGSGVSESPEQVLKGRFARGEIDEEEYRSRVTALRDEP